jgi:hypothetical protein
MLIILKGNPKELLTLCWSLTIHEMKSLNNGMRAGRVRGLPSPEALEPVQVYTLLRADRNGWIELSTDGEQMWAEAER